MDHNFKLNNIYLHQEIIYSTFFAHVKNMDIEMLESVSGQLQLREREDRM